MKKLSLLILTMIFLVSCTQKEPADSIHQEMPPSSEAKEETMIPSVPTGPDIDAIDLSLLPDESGEIMVIMYHAIGDEEEWTRSPENLRKDLRVLYERGYRPIRLRDFARGYIPTEAGFTPVVLTFDDAYESQFSFLEDGSIDPDCAVAILLEFHREHPDFPPAATFFAHGDIPFRQEGYEREKIRFLIDNGMDIGNHTRTHPDLTDADPETVQRELGAQAQYLQELSPEGYPIDLLALSYGSRPDREHEHYLTSGMYQGERYKNIAVLDVGWDPTLSPFDIDYSHAHIHRVRGSEIHVDGIGLYDWLERLDAGERKRFVSDGDPFVITVPEEAAEYIRVWEGMVLHTYDPEDYRP